MPSCASSTSRARATGMGLGSKGPSGVRRRVRRAGRRPFRLRCPDECAHELALLLALGDDAFSHGRVRPAEVAEGEPDVTVLDLVVVGRQQGGDTLAPAAKAHELVPPVPEVVDRNMQHAAAVAPSVGESADADAAARRELAHGHTGRTGRGQQRHDAVGQQVAAVERVGSAWHAPSPSTAHPQDGERASRSSPDRRERLGKKKRTYASLVELPICGDGGQAQSSPISRSAYAGHQAPAYGPPLQVPSDSPGAFTHR